MSVLRRVSQKGGLDEPPVPGAGHPESLSRSCNGNHLFLKAAALLRGDQEEVSASIHAHVLLCVLGARGADDYSL